MEPEEQVFAERALQLTGGGTVLVRFFRPFGYDGVFRSAYEIVWPDRRRSFYAEGVDGVQALLGAMQCAHADLLTSPEGKAGRLRWCGSEALDLPLAGSLTPEDFR